MGHLLMISVSIQSCCTNEMLQFWGIPKEDIQAWNKLQQGQLLHDLQNQDKILGGYRPGELEEEEEEDIIDDLQGFEMFRWMIKVTRTKCMIGKPK
eukprot:TRINITY_DN5205_c0_g1_i1.p1 TRINITY_DN5205_c0_g1~~TRINITY_DN5205_c0_g1_i1.p1  ORF type:complete len:96 (-),score=14.69 TRINITY_DN5205_c0_g1_i1:203-490(-)